ncbi:MAG TPA: phosphoribosyltransferase family protein [Planctomycetota bacterium]|nr:phosphoribosyltransferase family protein [Planctomycetota bacterium]
MAVLIHPMQIPGSWKRGYVLDYHTKSSDFLGYDEYGHPRFDTVRTEVGELLYRLKYRGRKDALEELVAVAAKFIKEWSPPLDAIVPVPPSKARAAQPVMRLATGLAQALGLPLHDVVRRKPSPKQLKDVFDYGERIKLLENAHDVTGTAVRGKSVLLVDDLYRSGATLNAVTAALYEQGKVSVVYAFCPTRTRSAS